MKFIPNAVTRKASFALLKTQKHSPTLLFATGLVGFAGTIVLASRATLQLGDVLDQARTDETDLEEYHERSPEIMSSEELIKYKAILKVRTAGKIFKLYAPSLAVAAVSVAALTGSHHILSKRNAAVTAAFATIQKGFSEYRERVVEDLGSDKDREYLHGVKTSTEVVVDENGKKKQVTKRTAAGVSPFGRLFNDSNPNWNPTVEYSLFFLKSQQNYVNDLLRVRGWVTLNEVYDRLGFEQTKDGMVIGWVLDNKDGDGKIDFGIWDSNDMHRVVDFMNDKHGELYLNFNFDGYIFDKVK